MTSVQSAETTATAAATRKPGQASPSKMRKTPAADVRMERILVSPDVAKAWLDRNIGNRNVSAKQVRKFARDMMSGRWEFTGESVRFDADHRLIDGQHRLMACVMAEVPFDTLVIYDLPAKTQSVIDTGKARSAANVLELAGTHYPVEVAAVARLVLAEKHGIQRASYMWSNSEVLDILDKHPGIAVSVRKVKGKRMARGLPGSPVSYIHFVGSADYLLDNPDRADAFVKVLQDGIPDYDGDPAHMLRERLLQTIGPRVRVRHGEALIALRYVWNLFAQRRPVRHLKWPQESSFEGLDLSKL